MPQRQDNELPQSPFVEAFRKMRRPLTLGHVTPDADAIGAALGLATAMRNRGIEATCGLPEGCVAGKLGFMLRLGEGTPLATCWTPDGTYDSVIMLDTATAKRINIGPSVDIEGPLPTFNIDHHITNTDFARHNWVDPHATSTCEIVTRLLEHLEWSISPAVASLLYCGIHADTGGFSLPSTSASSLHAAADLVRAGADVAHIGEQLCRSQAKPDFELLRRVYDHTELACDGQIAHSYLTHDNFLASGSKPEDIDDQVSIPLALKGVRMALLFTEGKKGVVRINLRGEGNVTVVELARRFGGGGHAQSAGVMISGRPIDDVIDEVVAAASEHLATFPA